MRHIVHEETHRVSFFCSIIPDQGRKNIVIVVMKPGTTREDVVKLQKELESTGCRGAITRGENYSIIGLVGDTGGVDPEKLGAHPGVDRVMRVQEPYKLANRMFHPLDSRFEIRGSRIGGPGNLAIMAGPCAVKSEEQLVGIARAVQQSGATFLRGGAFKPRTSPYSFQADHRAAHRDRDDVPGPGGCLRGSGGRDPDRGQEHAEL